MHALAVALALFATGPMRPLSFEGALAAARAERKPLLVQFTASWCSSCKELEMKTLSRGEVKEFLTRRFVAIQVDGEKGEGPALMKRFHIVGYPTLIVLDGEAAEVDRVFGFEDALPFVATLRGYLHGKGTIEELTRRLAASPGDLALRADLGERLAVRGARDAAIALLADTVNADLDNRAGRASKALLMLGKYLFLRGQNEPDNARRVFEALLGAYPTAKERGEARGTLAIAYYRLGDEARALSILNENIAQGAKKGDAYNSLAWFHFRERKDLARAISTAREGLAGDPRDDGLWDSLAEFLAQQKDRAGAVAAAKKALALKPDDAYYRYQVERFSTDR